MQKRFFNINYEVSRDDAWEKIDQHVANRAEADYICVADGNILQMVHRDIEYRKIVNDSMFTICDSNWVPVFIKWIYGFEIKQFCGSHIFQNAIEKKKYRMSFIGTSREVLQPLRKNITEKYDPRIAEMQFMELPFRKVDDFDYEGIAKEINDYDPDIIWIALGAPKQEIFMNNLKPHLKHGLMLGVGAAFKFYSGFGEKRAPEWMIRNRMEFIYRLFVDPKKQGRRCWMILTTLPAIFMEEWRKKRVNDRKI